jgi:hypothetical protein
MLIFDLPRLVNTDPALTLRIDPDLRDSSTYGYEVLDAGGNILLAGQGRPAAATALTARDAAMSVAAQLAAEGALLADHAGHPEYCSHYSTEGRAVLAANYHRFRILSHNEKTPPAGQADPQPSDGPTWKRLLATAIEDGVRDGLQAAEQWIPELAATTAATTSATDRTNLHGETEDGTDETFLPPSPEGNVGNPASRDHLPRAATASPASPRETRTPQLELLAGAYRSAFNAAVREHARGDARRPLDPAAGGRDPARLQPENIRVGQVGVFSGDWSWSVSNDGPDFPRLGYVGTLTGTWNGAAVFTCTRQVAEAIVAHQRTRRANEQATLQADGVPEAAARQQVDDALPKLSFDGDTIVVDQRAMSGEADAIERVTPDANGRYKVGWGWGWHLVDPRSCHHIIGELPPQLSE